MLISKKTSAIIIILVLALSILCIPALVEAANTEKNPNNYKALMNKILKTSGINDLLAKIINTKIPLGQSSLDSNQNNYRINSAVQPWNFEDHTATHPSLPTLSDSEIRDQLRAMNAAFSEHDLPPPLHIAYPNGDYNQRVIDIVRQYRLSGRLASSEGRFPETYPIQDWYRLCTINMAASTTPEVVINLINQAIQQRGLVNIFTHSVTDPPDGEGTTPARLAAVLDYLVEQRNAGNLDVLTMRQAYTQYNGQKAVVVFSFDDSWYTDYAVVWPMFNARGLVGTSYITSYLVDLNDPARLNWDQVREMAQVGEPEEGWTVSINSNPSAGGTTNPAGTLSTTGPLIVTATPTSGYVFDHWVFDGETLTSNPINLPAQEEGSSHTLTAYFVSTPPSWSITISSNPTAGGTTDPAGTHSVTGPLTITANPTSGYTFDHWAFDGAVLTVNPLTLPAQTGGSSHALTAYFTQVMPPGWSLSIVPTEGGTTNPNGTINGLTGPITVRAQPAAGYVFNYWYFDGAVISTSNPVTLPDQSDGTSHTLIAAFIKTLAASVSTDRARYTKWSYVGITSTVVDGPSGSGLQGASVTASVYDTHGRLVWSTQGVTDSAGKAKFTYKLGFNAQMGTYTVRITAEKYNYKSTTAQTTFYSLG